VDSSPDDLREIRTILRDLTTRVYRIERAMGLEPIPASQPLPQVPAATHLVLGERPPSEPPAAPSSQLPRVAVPPIYPSSPRSQRAASTSDGGLESRIGSHWLNRVGISAVLIGVSYFLKYAFDNNWIGPAGRVTIGLLAGIAAVLWSERFRSRGYQIFSYSLKAVGIGVLYLSLWAAFQVYNLFPGSVAFIAMLVVTAATAALALSQDAEILAAFALTGGFITPVLLSTGQNRELALFSCVAVLDLAVLVMLAVKPWRRLVLVSYIGTLLLYVGWYSEFYNRSQLNLTLGFATLFFAVFAIAPLAARPPEDEAGVFAAVPFILAFVNACVYFLQIYAMFEEVSTTWTAWFALALAGVYIFLSRITKPRYGAPDAGEKLRLLHLALAIGFITIAIPIRLDAHWITIGWFVEAAVLLWVADRIRSDLLNVFAVGALALGVVRLLCFDDFHSTQLIFNARMGTHAMAVAVLGVVAWYAAKRNDETGRNAAAIAVVALNALALIALTREVADYYAQQIITLRPRDFYRTNWSEYRSLEIARDFTYSALWMAYGAMLMVIGFWRKSAFVRWQALILIAVTTVKVFVYDTSQLDHIYRIVSFIALGILLLAVSFAYQKDWLQLSARKQSDPKNLAKS
jgi:uncharacterized membrane protein